jgi:Tfp pilus assembly pilus retraction ATPase PilT
MISNTLTQIKDQLSQEVQFRLGHKTLIKINNEWIEFDQQSLTLSDWEDLKDLCLQSNEKIKLETKGFVQGLFSDPTQTWVFSFTEWKDCMKAHFAYVHKQLRPTNIQYAPYFDGLKKKSGIHLISAHKKNGKSTLLSEIICENQKYSPELIAVHAPPSQLTVQNFDSVLHLGMESLVWEGTHAIYDGIDTLIVDANEIQDLNKWVRFAEEGRTVFLSLSASSIENVLLQIKSLTQDKLSLWNRFSDQIKSIVYQKTVPGANSAVQEIWVMQKEDQKKINDKFQSEEFKKLITGSALYQSLNQSILQSLVRRRFDVKQAFEASDDIEELDRSLKKMGL